MNTTLSTPRLALQNLLQARVVSVVVAVLFVAMLSLTSINVFAADEPLNDDVCATPWTRIALKDDVVSVYSGSVDGGPNGYLVGEFNLRDIPSITDEQRASGEVVWLLSQNLESAEGWTVNLYWQNDRYGATATGTVTVVDSKGVTTTTAFSDDTGARCVL